MRGNPLYHQVVDRLTVPRFIYEKSKGKNMSTTVISRGFIGALLQPISEHDHIEELKERLYDEHSDLDVNGDGTLVFGDENRNKPYSEREFNGDLFIVGDIGFDGREAFLKQCEDRGLSVDPNTVKPYVCVWYNGADSPLWYMTKDDFLAGNL